MCSSAVGSSVNQMAGIQASFLVLIKPTAGMTRRHDTEVNNIISKRQYEKVFIVRFLQSTSCVSV